MSRVASIILGLLRINIEAGGVIQPVSKDWAHKLIRRASYYIAEMSGGYYRVQSVRGIEISGRSLMSPSDITGVRRIIMHHDGLQPHKDDS
jgi:hypothetical protein